MLVIGITGRARSGKDTVADILVKEFGFVKLGMADTLYEIASKYYGWNGEKDEKGRRLLQILGTEAGRIYNEDLWINHIKRRMNAIIIEKGSRETRFVISGVRYPNEANFIKNAGGYIWKVVGRGGIGDKHSSEQYIDDIFSDCIIPNDCNMTLDELNTLVSHVVKPLILYKEIKDNVQNG